MPVLRRNAYIWKNSISVSFNINVSDLFLDFWFVANDTWRVYVKTKMLSKLHLCSSRLHQFSGTLRETPTV